MTAGLSGRIHTGLTSRWLTAGSAIQNGLTAALAAETGFVGDLKILDGAFASVFGLEFDPLALYDGLGREFNIRRISLKPHCTARQSLAPVEAFRQLMVLDGLDPESVDGIDVLVPEQYRGMIDIAGFPEAREASVVSVRYQMALAAFYPDGLYDLHRKDLKDDQRIRALLPKIQVNVRDEYTARYPRKWPALVRVRVGGKTLEREVISPPGDPDLPMSLEDVARKIANLTVGILSGDEGREAGRGSSENR